jgi:hypothetical protein
VNSYTALLGRGIREAPQLPPAGNYDYQFTATVDCKRQQYDWGLLRGILEREVSRSQ